MTNEYILDIAAFEMWQREDTNNERDDEAFKNIVKKVIQNELNEKEREFVYLYFYDRHTLEEIAKLSNVSITAVWQRKQRIKRKLYVFLKYAAELHYGRAM